ncbi:hypothetical protein M3Y99_01017500 [Aphelenchoides fujianensis]|nr:hypothetical protein M3Y99_01017500 [Aphelenchoides fujianensis]
MLPAVERPGLFARIKGEAAIPLVLLFAFCLYVVWLGRFDSVFQAVIDWIRGEDLNGVFFEKARKWRFDGNRFLEQELGNNTNCAALIEKFAFVERPLSAEEAAYPLAYGMIVYTDVAQVFFLLSAIYQPQNAHCIAVDGKSTPDFKRRIHELAGCLPNITVIEVPPVGWCTASVLDALYTCFSNLTFSDHPWQYYQYVTGFDLPLKTDLEIVRIFKQLNKTVMTEITDVGRLGGEKTLPVWKTGMGALVPRAAARFAVGNELVQQTVRSMIEAKEPLGGCPDEHLWATVFGNRKLVPAPGSYDVESFYEKVKAEFGRISQEERRSPLPNYTPTAAEPVWPKNQEVARHQVWSGECHGEWTGGSCVFGLGDLPALAKRWKLVAHKFHWNVEPAAYFCWWAAVRERAFDGRQAEFRGRHYARLSQVRVKSGESLAEIPAFLTELEPSH